jgi:hypothetical protein
MNDKVSFYLPPAEFFAEVLKCKIDGKISERLGRMFLLLSEKTTNHRYWIRYAHLKEDMVAESCHACIRAFKGYRPFTPAYVEEHGEWDGVTMVDYDYISCYNPHGWFTTSIMNRLKQFMRAEYNQLNIVNKQKVALGLDPSFGYEEVMEKEYEDSGLAATGPEETLFNDRHDVFGFGEDDE